MVTANVIVAIIAERFLLRRQTSVTLRVWPLAWKFR
jgi:hypothetical protein